MGSISATWEAAISQPYYAYTRRYDEVLEASELADQAEVMTLYDFLSKHVSSLKKVNDTVLHRMLSPYQGRINKGLAVTVLLDNSGSMRGGKILSTAAWSLLIGEWMDRLGIPTEFLGFTTRAWKGGQSRELWLADGKTARPGRLNDLRHVIYKRFSADITASAPSFGVMAREGLLKENIDGEALLWAASRLLLQPASNRILFVFSDGAPVDDSTLSVNAGNFLEKHLLSVIPQVSRDITLYGVGIGYDLGRYYPNAIRAKNLNYLGRKFFEALIADQSFHDCFSLDAT